MTREDRKKILEALAAPFPEEAIERTDGRITGRGYSTTGIKYQFVVNRLNNVLGVGSFRAHRDTTVKEITTNSGRTAYEAWCDLVLELGEWVDGQFVVFAEALADGGHTSTSEADARKGAYTNAFKKAAAFFGCGRQAYEGTIDDDHVPPDSTIPIGPETGSEQVPGTGYVRTGTNGRSSNGNGQTANGNGGGSNGKANGARNRITAKQLAAIWAIARKSGYVQGDLRRQIKDRYGVQPEFLPRDQASEVIGALNEGAFMGNGHDHGNGAAQPEPGWNG